MAKTFIDLFAGVGGARRGLELAGFECIGFCEWDKFASAAYRSMHTITDEQRQYLETLPKNKRVAEINKEEYLNGEWYGKDICDVTGDSIPKADIWAFGAPCFVASSLVTTSDGLKPIEDVEVGDMVLTHKNRFKKVLRTMQHPAKGIYTLSMYGSEKVECTGNHRFWVRYQKDGTLESPKWVAIKDFTGSEYICVPHTPDEQVCPLSELGKFADDNVWEPVRNVVCDKDREETVYNLEVEDDESYTVNNLGAHNCTSFSLAGKRKGLDGESGLILEVFRILTEIPEESRPEWLIYENVSGMLSSNKGWDFFAILAEMDSLGYDCEWQTFNSKEFGVPQNRVRIYTIGHRRDLGDKRIYPIAPPEGERPVLADILQHDVPEKYYLKKEQVEKIVFEKPTKSDVDIIAHKNGYRRNTQVFGKEGITEALDTAQGGGRGHHTADIIGTARPTRRDSANIFGSDGITEALKARDYKDPHMVADAKFVDLTTKSAKLTDEARCLKARYDAGVTNRSADNSGVAMPVVIDDQGRVGKEVKPSDTVPTLRAQAHGNEPKVVEQTQIPVSFSKGEIQEEIDTAHCLSANGPAKEGMMTHQKMNRVLGVYDGYNQEMHDDAEEIGTITRNVGNTGRNGQQIVMPVLTPDRAHKRQNGRRFKEDGEEAFTLTAADKHGVAEGVPNEVIDDTYANRPARVTDDAPTLRSGRNGIKVTEPQLMGGLGEKNFGKQFRQQNRIYDSEHVSPSICSALQWYYGVPQRIGALRDRNEKSGRFCHRDRIYDTEAVAPAQVSSSASNYAETVEAPKQGDGIWVDMPGGFKAWAVWYERYQCYITIRKLTPRECYRLQAWDDEYFDKAEFVISDSQLFKTAGNGITVSVAGAVAKGIAKTNE